MWVGACGGCKVELDALEQKLQLMVSSGCGRAASALNPLCHLSVLRGAELEGFASAFRRISVVEDAERNLVCGSFRAYL